MVARGVARASAGAHRRAGFSLVELMAVVSITAILAAIAIPTFQGYIMKSRTSEAPQMLGMIKLRQEAYKGEFGQYLQINENPDPDPTAMEYDPGDHTVMSGGNRKMWFPCSTCPNFLDWQALGVSGDMVRFGYGIAAGNPTDADTYVTGDPYYFAKDDYYIIQAVADLDGDSDPCMFEVYSQTTKVYYEPAKGWE